jgi:hypothetical protein
MRATLSVFGDVRVRQNSPPQGGNIDAEGYILGQIAMDE